MLLYTFISRYYGQIHLNFMLKKALFIAFLAGIAFAGYRSYQLYILQKHQSELKEHFAEIQRVNYGLFNLQLWKDKALDIIEGRITDFAVDPKIYKEVEGEMEIYLRRVYDEYIESGKLFDQIFDEAERQGKMNKMFLKLLKDNLAPQIKLLNIKSYIPSMADQLTEELKKSEPQLKGLLEIELKRMLKETSPDVFKDPREGIYQYYGQADLPSTVKHLSTEIQSQEDQILTNLKILYALLLGLVVIGISLYKILGFQLVVTTVSLISILFLALGVSMPMIDIDARLNDFRMTALGVEVGFDEQVLYYQSKSILQVTQTMIQNGGTDLKIVGVLILMFSIVIPFIKLVLSALYLFVKRIRGQKVVEIILFYLGKWSMADVFVVAMFMAYIGFYGLVTAQLGDIGRNQTGFAVETLNYSRLAPGALFFTTYCILSIITGMMIHRWKRKNDTNFDPPI